MKVVRVGDTSHAMPQAIISGLVLYMDHKYLLMYMYVYLMY